jgi:hypothetical protein
MHLLNPRIDCYVDFRKRLRNHPKGPGNLSKCTQGDPLNASDAISLNLDPVSNVTDSSDRQREKLSSPMTLTRAGMKMLLKPLDENAKASIRRSCDPVSSTTDSSNEHSEKHLILRISTLAGMKIESHE